MLINGDPFLEEIIFCILGNPLINLTYFLKIYLAPQQIPGFLINQLLVDLRDIIVLKLRLFA